MACNGVSQIGLTLAWAETLRDARVPATIGSARFGGGRFGRAGRLCSGAIELLLLLLFLPALFLQLFLTFLELEIGLGQVVRLLVIVDVIVHAAVLPEKRRRRHLHACSLRRRHRVGSTDSTSASQRPGDGEHEIVPFDGW